MSWAPASRFHIPTGAWSQPPSAVKPWMIDRENVSSNPHHEAVGNKKVSSLYVPYLSMLVARWHRKTSLVFAAEAQAKGTEATGTPGTGSHRVSRIAAQGRHPLLLPTLPSYPSNHQPKMPLAVARVLPWGLGLRSQTR